MPLPFLYSSLESAWLRKFFGTMLNRVYDLHPFLEFLCFLSKDWKGSFPALEKIQSAIFS